MPKAWLGESLLTVNFISFYALTFLLKLRTKDLQLNSSFQKDGRWIVTHLTVSDFCQLVTWYFEGKPVRNICSSTSTSDSMDGANIAHDMW